MASIDTQAVRDAYIDVRDDKTETNWAAFVYEGDKIIVRGKGIDNEEFLELMRESPDQRMYGFIRVETGDELSRRKKFAFIVFIGEDVSALQKARCSTHKTQMKQIIQEFAKEFLYDGTNDIESMEKIIDEVKKAGGANYNG